jgi:hypothetical protein
MVPIIADESIDGLKAKLPWLRVTLGLGGQPA